MAKPKNPAPKRNDDDPDLGDDVDETIEKPTEEVADLEGELGPPETDSEARAESYLESTTSTSRFVVNDGDPDLHYTWFNPSRMRPVLAEQKRANLKRRGFDPVNGPHYKGDPRPEHVPAAPDCELWSCPKKTAQRFHNARLEKALSSDEYRRMQAQRVRQGGFLEDAVRGTGVKIKSPGKVEKLAREARKHGRND